MVSLAWQHFLCIGDAEYVSICVYVCTKGLNAGAAKQHRHAVGSGEML